MAALRDGGAWFLASLGVEVPVKLDRRQLCTQECRVAHQANKVVMRAELLHPQAGPHHTSLATALRTPKFCIAADNECSNTSIAILYHNILTLIAAL